MSKVVITRLIIDPIHVYELSKEDKEDGITDAASAIITLPSGTQIAVPKEGGTFEITEPLFEGARINGCLYIYDRQPNTSFGFCVDAEPLKATNGVAHMNFSQGWPAICFHLINIVPKTDSLWDDCVKLAKSMFP